MRNLCTDVEVVLLVSAFHVFMRGPLIKANH